MSQIQVFGSGNGAGSHPVGSGTHCIYIRFVFRRHGHDLLHVADIINLVEAVQDEEKKEQYKEVFSIALGDTVLLISKSTGIRESHRIVKFYEYPLTKEKNKVELANTRLSFEEVQRTEQELS